MTRWGLQFISDLKCPLGIRLVGALLLLVLCPVTLFVDAVWLVVRLVRLRHILTAEVVYCTGGHQVDLQAAWKCRCGVVVEGSAWEPCPSCGELGFIACPCGRTLLNPLQKKLGLLRK